MNLILALVMLAAALLASLFGQGGGVLYTPIQVFSGISFQEAAATSLFLVLVISLSSTLVFRKEHEVDWLMAILLETPTMLGAFLGGIVSHWISSFVLGLILGGLLIVAAFFMIFPLHLRNPNPEARSGRWVWKHTWNGVEYGVNLLVMVPVMLAVGLLTSMVGIGGGVLKVPVMVLLFGIPMHIAVGSSAFMVGLTATAGLLGHAAMGHWNWQASLLLAIPVFLGGQIGSRISVRLGTHQLAHWFGWFLLAVAILILLRLSGIL